MGIDKLRGNSAADTVLRRRTEELISEVESPDAQHIRDHDEAKKLVHELQVHQIELNMQNSELRQTLVKVMDELRRKDEMLTMHARHAAMGEMINNIAHQWRQPLNTLGLLIQHLPLCFDSGEFSREYLKETSAKSMKLIQQMSQTIDDFSNFFRSDKVKTNFGVNRVIEQTVSLVEKSLLDKQIKITLLADGDPIVHGYPNEYSQVILNILMNAWDALIANRNEDARISIKSFAQEGTSVVTITDNGGGIPEDVIEKLFDPYYTTKGPDKGAGIGLFMSKTIIENNMGGKLTVCNTGSGAEFRIEV